MSLSDLEARVERLEFVIAVLLGELRRIGGETAPLAYVQEILAPQGRGDVVDLKSNGHPKGG